MRDERKTKAQLIAELSAARQRVEELEAAWAAHEQLDEQIRLKATKYSILFDLFPLGITLTDPTGQIIESNREAERLLEIPNAEQENRTYDAPEWRIIRLDGSPMPPEEFASVRALKENRRIADIEMGIVKGGRRITWLNVTAQPLALPGYGVAITYSDISDRVQAQAALRESERRHRLLVDNAGDVIWTMDLTGRFTYVSPSVERLRGYTVEEVLQQSVDQALTPDSAAIAVASLAEAIQVIVAGQPFPPARHELEQPCRDGSTVWTEVTTSGIYDEAGQVVGVLGVTRDITERRRIAAQLRETTEELDRFFSFALDLLCIADTDGYFRRLNRSWEQTLGYPLAELEGKRFLELVHPDDQAATLSAMADLSADKPVLSFTNRYRCQNGEYRWLEWRAFPFDGKLIYAAARDITDRKRVEAAEREQRELAEALRDTVAALNSTLDFDEVLDRILANIGRVVPHDAANIMLIDGDPTDGIAYIVRRRGYDRISPALDEAVSILRFSLPDVANLRQMVSTGQPHIIHDSHADPDWVDVPGTDWQRSSLGMPIILRDKTVGFIHLDSGQPGFFTPTHAERLRAFANQAAIAIQNAQLHEAVQRYAADLEQRVADRTADLDSERSRLQAILDSVDEGVYFMNSKFQIQYANAATTRITGFAGAEILGRTPKDLWRTDSTPTETLNQMDAAVTHGQAWKGEVVNQHHDGRRYDVALSITPLWNVHGMHSGWVTVYRDISHWKELERLKGQFVHRIGHELRTPLTNLIIYLDLLEHGKPEKREKYLQTLRGEADRMRRLIEGFVRISELDAQSSPLNLRPVNVNEVAAGLLMRYRDQAIERQIAMEPEFAPDLPLTQGTAEWVTEAIGRVLENALNYTPRGGHIVLKSALRHEAEMAYSTLTITDSGPGLSPADSAHLFERFYRGEAARDYKTPGVGLSLTICKTIMEKISGRITADSLPGQGATFTLWFRSD